MGTRVRFAAQGGNTHRIVIVQPPHADGSAPARSLVADVRCRGRLNVQAGVAARNHTDA